MLYRDGITSGTNAFTNKTLAQWAMQMQETYVTLGTKIEAVCTSTLVVIVMKKKQHFASFERHSLRLFAMAKSGTLWAVSD
jgi:hypothetical protein